MDLPDPGIEPGSLALQVDSSLSGKPDAWKITIQNNGYHPVRTDKDQAMLWASLVAQLVKNPPAVQETWV